MTEKLSIVFFGSGPVAAQSLNLLATDFSIEAIITKPTTIGEMQEICPEAPIHAVTNKHSLSELSRKIYFKSKLAVLVDFGIIVDPTVIDSFPLGIINSHFSLLPEWRGADPISFSILSGQQRTGVSIMLLTEGMDEGPLLAQAPYDIPVGSTTPTLTNALIELSDVTLKAIIPGYMAGSLSPQPQATASILGSTAPTYSRKLRKEDGILNWKKSAVQLEREVRAFISWPKSQTTLAGRQIIVTAAQAAQALRGEPGTIKVEGRHLYVHCGEGSLEITRLKPAGKSDMPVEAFLAGYRSYL